MNIQILIQVAGEVEKNRVAQGARLSGLEGKVIGPHWNYRTGGDGRLNRVSST